MPWTTDFYLQRVNATAREGDLTIAPTKRCCDNTTKCCDPGWGVDVKIQGNASVTSTIWDDDGDGYFQVSQGPSAYCKVDTGSNGLGPGASVEIYEVKGLACRVRVLPLSSVGHYAVVIDVNRSHKEDCKSYSPDDPTNTCPGPIMLGAQLVR